MIPADVASRLRFVQPDQPAPTQPATASQKLADVLSDLQPGQRVLAEIQGQLPNGTYRAIVAQRDITLALPFSARTGDTLELEVVDSDGKVALAFVANRSGKDETAQAESAATSLSKTGRLIGNLIGNISEPGQRANPAPLNGNLPLVDSQSINGHDLAPVLKNALTQSGVFYEAHQARWAAGELATDALRQEPQGKMLPEATVVASAGTLTRRDEAESATTGNNIGSLQQAVGATGASNGGTMIPHDLLPIVQQQLDALATQTYAWQGQIWPGQTMHWEVSENLDRQQQEVSGAESTWQTRLRLVLPSLGGIDASLRLHPGVQVELSLTTTTPESESRLRAQISELRSQFEASGLTLTQAQIQHGEIGK